MTSTPLASDCEAHLSALAPLAPPDYPTDSFTDHLLGLQESLHSIDMMALLSGAANVVLYQLFLTVLIFGLWLADGHPGIWLPASLTRTR